MVACGSFASYGSWDNLFHLFCNHTLHNKNVFEVLKSNNAMSVLVLFKLSSWLQFFSAVSTFNNFPISISWRSQRLLQSVRKDANVLLILKIVGSHWGQVGAKNCSPKKAPKILHSGIRVSQVARMISKKRETNKQTWLTPLGVWKARGCIWLTPLLSHRSRAIEDFLTWKSFFYDHTNKIPKHPEKIILCSHPPLPAALESDFPPVHQLHRNTWPNKRCLITSKSNCSDFKGEISTPLP